MSKQKIIFSGGQALLAAAFLFALTNVLVREMSGMWGDNAQVAVRFALVWVLLTAFAVITRKKLSIPRNKLWIAVSYSVIAAFSILLFTFSLQQTSIANTLFTATAMELFVAFLLGSVLLKESITKRKLIAIVLSLIGLALYSNSIIDGNTGVLLGLLAGVTVGICNLLAKKLKGVNNDAVIQMQFGVGAILMIILTLLFAGGDIIRTVSLEGIIITFVFALVLIFATRFVLYGFQHSDINIATVIVSSQLAISVLLGFIFYLEIPAPHEIVSGVLIMTAAVIGSTERKTLVATRQNRT